jgi:hypothetical protein
MGGVVKTFRQSTCTSCCTCERAEMLGVGILGRLTTRASGSSFSIVTVKDSRATEILLPK